MNIIEIIKTSEFAELQIVENKIGVSYLRLILGKGKNRSKVGRVYGVKIFEMDEKTKAIETFYNDSAFIKWRTDYEQTTKV